MAAGSQIEKRAAQRNEKTTHEAEVQRWSHLIPGEGDSR